MLSLTIILLLILYILAAALFYIWLIKGHAFKLADSSKILTQSICKRSYKCIKLIYI